MKLHLIAGAAFGALFLFACATARAMPPADLLEAAPRFEPPTPRIAPGLAEVLLASSVLRTLDGQTWTPPDSAAEATPAQSDAQAPMASAGPLLGAHASDSRAPEQVERALRTAMRAALPQTSAIPAPVQFVANPAPEAPIAQIAQAEPAAAVEPAAAPVEVAAAEASVAPTPAPETPTAAVEPAPEVIAPPLPTTSAPTLVAGAAEQPAPTPSLGEPPPALPAPPPAEADAPAPLLQQAAYSDSQARQSWRDIINPADAARLKTLLATRAAAIKQAEAAIDSGDKAAMAAAPATSSVLYAKVMTALESDLVGAYRCRITRLGGAWPQLVAHRFTTCDISQWPDGSLVLEKTSGTDRFIGRLWREADSSFVYLGTVMPEEGVPWAYDEKPAENQVGRLYRIGQNRLRLELPKPNSGSALDIVEFVRLK